MADQQRASALAVTINVNPNSYVSIPSNGKMVRQKWGCHPKDDQRFFLDQFKNLLARYNINLLKVIYRYEITEKGNVHAHYDIKCEDNTQQAVEKAKRDFCLLVDKKMPINIMDRCILIKEVFDHKGWVNYVTKDDAELSDDEPIEVPKYNMFLRTKVIKYKQAILPQRS